MTPVDDVTAGRRDEEDPYDIKKLRYREKHAKIVAELDR
jgi:hypothetical protein